MNLINQSVLYNEEAKIIPVINLNGGEFFYENKT